MGNNNAAQAVESAPVPTPAPPVTANDPSVIQAENDQAQATLLKKSVKRTIDAGDTAGFNPKNPNIAGAPANPTSFKTKLG